MPWRTINRIQKKKKREIRVVTAFRDGTSFPLVGVENLAMSVPPYGQVFLDL